MILPQSTPVKHRALQYSGGNDERFVKAEVRWDDRCNNGHNTFSITGSVYEPNASLREGYVLVAEKPWRLASCGCVHEKIAECIPTLAPYLKWHLVSSGGPLHYPGNVLYLAGDRDCWGLRKGEQRQLRDGKTGKLAWILESPETSQIDAPVQPPPVTLQWKPWCRIGEGKEREFDKARSSAVWPEATDEVLSKDPAEPREILMARLPALMLEFKAAIESLGFEY